MDRTGEIEVREAELPRDLDTIWKLGLDAATLAACQTDADWVVALRGGEPCGAGAIRSIGIDIAKITLLYVEPGRRGLGVGSRMLEALLLQAGGSGHFRVIVDRCPPATVAYRLLKGFGFVEQACTGEGVREGVMEWDARAFWRAEIGVAVSQ